MEILIKGTIEEVNAYLNNQGDEYNDNFDSLASEVNTIRAMLVGFDPKKFATKEEVFKEILKIKKGGKK